jgi:pilus assembly protein CpaB
MKAARLIVLGVALTAGGIAAYIASGSRQPEQKAPEPPPPPALATVDVLIAENDLSTGQTIGDRDIGWQAWPAAAANAGFIKKTERPDAISQFAGAVVRMPVAQGEPIRENKVIIGKRGGYLAAVLPTGIRAVSLDVSPDTAAGGFILPNDHVDVLLTHHDKTGERNGAPDKFVTETILRNVQVLAIDQNVGEKDGEKVVIGKTATIALTPDQAERLALAHQLGSLSLALRSVVDSQSLVPQDGVAKKESDDGKAINTVRFGIGAQTTTR